MSLIRRRKRLLFILLLLLCLGAIVIVINRRLFVRSVISVSQRLRGRATVADRLEQFGEAVHGRMQPYFDAAGIPYPPARLVLVGLKTEKVLRVYAAAEGSEPKLVREYPILAASGGPGPKLREGDLQVPEGIYGIEYLNPNSMFHLSMAVSYPNDFDKARAREEDRRNPGGDIMIHGSDQSIGCLAMGDEAAEDLFVLVAETGVDKVKVVLAPNDLRFSPPPDVEAQRDWLPDLYDQLRRELNALSE
ncbi:MAG: L,D-transpeptidase family protein [Candidatus Sumerlaeaceae bacterium]